MQTLEHYMGVSIWIIFVFIFLSLVAIVYSFIPKKQDKWRCETCDITLVRSQIKFGLCPQCAKRVKGFRGLHPNRF